MMNEFINDLGYNNLMIIIAIIVAIVFALIIIFIIEKVQKNKKDFDAIEKYEPDSNVYYKKQVTEEEAKKKLDDAYEKLSNDEELITYTNFENEQEEKSIISYD